MITSMTGFGAGVSVVVSGDGDGDGDAEGEGEGEGVGTITVEIKSVNGRFLKTAWRLPAAFARHESTLDARVRQQVRRGSLNITAVLQRQGGAGVGIVNEDAVRYYQQAFARLGLNNANIPLLPGVVDGPDQTVADEPMCLALQNALQQALQKLCAMREREGCALTRALEVIVDRIDTDRQAVAERAPAVVLEYRAKLRERLAVLLESSEADVDPQLLAREVAVFADRCDVTEEVDRLGSHVQQVRELLSKGGEVGRTLDFLAQEMHREVNTIGSKSADALLSRHVVALKADIERLKEQVANVE